MFGAKSPPSHRVSLDGQPLQWENQCKYLGVTLKSGTSFCCIKRKERKETIGKFYRALNSVIRIEGRSDDMVMLRLLEAHCVPILSYAIEILHVSDSNERRQLRVAYNSVYRKMFGYSYRESVSLLQRSLKRPTWEELIDKRNLTFKSVFVSALLAL